MWCHVRLPCCLGHISHQLMLTYSHRVRQATEQLHNPTSPVPSSKRPYRAEIPSILTLTIPIPASIPSDQQPLNTTHMAAHLSQDILQHIKALYHTYRHTPSPSSKGVFFSPTCLQICRPVPSYSATSRAQIVQYLRDAERGKVPISQHADTDMQSISPERNPNKDGPVTRDTSYYTIRPLHPSEHTFGTELATSAIGLTSSALENMSQREGWVGMRVDLWDEGSEEGLLVKVQYWWRLETVSDEGGVGDKGVEGEERDGKVWRQCLHDIVYLGPRDGTEGTEGIEILR